MENCESTPLKLLLHEMAMKVFTHLNIGHVNVFCHSAKHIDDAFTRRMLSLEICKKCDGPGAFSIL